MCPFSRVTETCLSGPRRFDRKLRAEESSTRVHMSARARTHTHTHTPLDPTPAWVLEFAVGPKNLLPGIRLKVGHIPKPVVPISPLKRRRQGHCGLPKGGSCMGPSGAAHPRRVGGLGNTGRSSRSCPFCPGTMVELTATSSQRAYATPRSAVPRAPVPLAGHC